MNLNPSKFARDDNDEEPVSRTTKAKKVNFELPSADVDLKLAEKLDSILKISNNTKPKFYSNKSKQGAQEKCSTNITSNQHLKPRNLSKEELHERVLKKYDTLVSEKDTDLPKKKIIFLSTTESVEVGKDQARKQLERQLELNSVSGNQAATKYGIQGFKFNDGYEMPSRYFSDVNHTFISDDPGGSALEQGQKSQKNSKSVRFSSDNQDEDEDAPDDPLSDDSSESD